MAVPAFAAMESIVNSGVKVLLANATLGYLGPDGARDVVGIFHDTRQAGDTVGMPRAARELWFECRADEVDGLNAGTPVEVRGQPYTAGPVERDKTGWIRIPLRSAA